MSRNNAKLNKKQVVTAKALYGSVLYNLPVVTDLLFSMKDRAPKTTESLAACLEAMYLAGYAAGLDAEEEIE